MTNTRGITLKFIINASLVSTQCDPLTFRKKTLGSTVDSQYFPKVVQCYV